MEKIFEELKIELKKRGKSMTDWNLMAAAEYIDLVQEVNPEYSVSQYLEDTLNNHSEMIEEEN